METIVLIAAFAVIGGGLKYIDEAFDEESFNKKIAAILSIVLLLLWIGLSILDPASRTILLSILVGVLLTGKIDNTIFGISATAILGFFLFIENVVTFPLLFLSLTGVLDERGNDYVDNHRSKKHVEFFFLHRFTMKIGLFILCLVGFFPFQYILAFLLFDVSYDTIGYVSNNRLNAKIEKPITIESTVINVS